MAAHALRALIRLRFFVLALWMLPWTLAMFPRGPLDSDWWVFEYGARQLSGLRMTGSQPVEGGPLHLYTWFPRLQVGPPALLATVPSQLLTPVVGRIVAIVAMLLVGLLALALLERIAALVAVPAARACGLTLVGGLLLVPAWCELAVFYMHLDDVIALTLLLVAVHELLRGRWWTMAIVLGIGAATKPWAIAFFPLLLLVPRLRRSHAFLLALGATAVWWAPFLVADPRTLDVSGSVVVRPAIDSTLHLLGVASSGGPLRMLQLALMLVVGLLVVRAGRWPALLFAVVAVRMLTDPQTWLYYTTGLVLGALLLDMLATRRRWPWFTTAATALLLVEWRVSLASPTGVEGAGGWVAALRVAVLLPLVVYLAWPARAGGFGAPTYEADAADPGERHVPLDVEEDGGEVVEGRDAPQGQHLGNRLEDVEGMVLSEADSLSL